MFNGTLNLIIKYRAVQNPTLARLSVYVARVAKAQVANSGCRVRRGDWRRASAYQATQTPKRRYKDSQTP